MKLWNLFVFTFVAIASVIPSKAIANECNIFVVFDPQDTYVNLRQTPNGKVVERINNGQKMGVSFADSSPEWSYVNSTAAQNRSGYMKSSLLWYGTTHYAIDSQDTFVNLRSSPNGQIIRRVVNGTPLTILPEKAVNGWVKIRLNIGDRATGYMSRNLIANPTCKPDGTYF